MKPVDPNLVSLYQNQTSEKQTQRRGISPDIWIRVWSRLEATKLIWEELDSSTSEYWRVTLDGLTEQELMKGCDGADEWSQAKANFTVGAFRKLCRKDRLHPSHKPFEALPASTPLPPEEAHNRAKEILEMIKC